MNVCMCFALWLATLAGLSPFTSFALLLLLLADQEAGVLDRACCLNALAALRHAKWFQVCNPSSVVLKKM